jgi:hypothetical protein
VYVAGEVYSAINYVAKYWNNGRSVAPFSLSQMVQITPGQILSMFQKAIFMQPVPNLVVVNFFVAKYWMNGGAVAITDSSNYSMASCIAVQDQEIYIAGKELQEAFVQSLPVAGYWKDGKEITVQDSSHSGGWTTSVFLAENSSQDRKKKLNIAFQGIYNEQQNESHTFGDILFSIFHFLKSSPVQSSTTNKGSHSYRDSRPANPKANQSKQIAESNRK